MTSTRKRISIPSRILAVALFVAATGSVTQAAVVPPVEQGEVSRGAAKAALRDGSLHFVPNRGQLDGPVDYYLQGHDTSVYFTPKGLTFSLRGESAEGAPRRWAVKLDFVGANRVHPAGRARTPATISYFKGPEDQWETAIPTFSEIVYKGLWPGIDLVYAGTGQALKYSFIVHPGADPDDIRLAYRGARSVQSTAAGRLRVDTPVGGFSDAAPRSFQRVGGRRTSVATSYSLGAARARGRAYGFSVGEYDPTRTLVVDPAILVYAGFIGGSGVDNAFAVAVDPSGNAYVTGFTESFEASFPETAGSFDTTHDTNSDDDAFVAKVTADGSSLAYATYLGGSGSDFGRGIAVDSAGNAYVTGSTNDPSFPATAGSFDSTLAPGNFGGNSTDAFVAKINASGSSLVYAGYIGGAGTETGYGIAVDTSDNAYVTGITNSTTAEGFPVTDGSLDTVRQSDNEANDAFVTKINAAGTGFGYSGYIGGDGQDFGYGIAVDSTGNAYVVGETSSSDGQSEGHFPATAGSFDETYGFGHFSLNFGGDGFVVKVNSDGSGRVYGAFIGGSGYDRAVDVAVDSDGNAYVTGVTQSSETGTPDQRFPATGGPDVTYNGDGDGFLIKINPGGSALDYGGFLGGTGGDGGDGVAVDSSGNAYVTGETISTDFPVTGGPDDSHNGGSDAFVTKVDAAGDGLVYSGYIGGSSSDGGQGLDVDSAGDAFVAGYTNGSGFPVTAGSFDSSDNGFGDAFVAKVSDQAQPEVCDGVDNDGDESVDEGFTDTDTDGTADCVDTDDDGDGFSDSDEIDAGSDPLDPGSIPGMQASPSSATIVNGTLRSGSASDLDEDDDAYYEVNSTTTSTRKAVWYGVIDGVPNDLSSLELSYKGKNSRSCTQKLFIRDFLTNTWTQLDSRAVGTTEVLLEETIGGTLADYVSGASGPGQIGILLQCATSAGSFFTSADLMEVSYSVPPDTTAPSVDAVSPPADAAAVDTDTTVVTMFSEPMNEGSAEAAFSLDSAALSAAAAVDGSFSWSGNTMTFTPSAPLAPDTTYTAEVGTGAQDLGGNPLSEAVTWSFITAGAPTIVHPSSATIVNGTLRSGSAANLDEDDDVYYEVNSTTASTRKTVWYGVFNGVPNELTSLDVSYKGKNSLSCTQKLLIWNFATNTWTQLDSRAVGTTEVLVEETVGGTLANHVSGGSGPGQIGIGVQCTTTAGTFFASADLMEVTYGV